MGSKIHDELTNLLSAGCLIFCVSFIHCCFGFCARSLKKKFYVRLSGTLKHQSVLSSVYINCDCSYCAENDSVA